MLVFHFALIFWTSIESKKKEAFHKGIEKKLTVKTVNLNPAPVQVKERGGVQSLIVEEIPKIVEPLPEKLTTPPPQEILAKIETQALPPIPEKKSAPTPIVLDKPVPKKVVHADKPIPKKTIPKVNKPEIKASEPSKKEQPVVDKQDKRIEEENKAKQIAAQNKQRELLAKAQESIAKIDQSRGKMTANKSPPLTNISATPSRIEALSVDSIHSDDGKPLSDREIGYRDELGSRLKLLLKLPEHGEVRIKLTLGKTGTVISCKIVGSKSKVNQAYIEKTIPTLNFPSLGNAFGDVEQYTFLISLSNE